jgi:hypothetical protein
VDNFDSEALRRRPLAQFSPDARLTALAGAGAVIALGLCFATDADGRLLFLVAAVILAAYAISDLVFRPRLSVDATGLRVRAPLARAHIAWRDLERVHADERSRYGLRTVTLEIDGGEHLIVLTRRALGAAPEAVADLVRSFDPRAV